MLTWEISVLDLLLHFVVVSGIWTIISLRIEKNHEKRLEKKLDKLYERIVKYHEKGKEGD